MQFDTFVFFSVQHTVHDNVDGFVCVILTMMCFVNWIVYSLHKSNRLF